MTEKYYSTSFEEQCAAYLLEALDEQEREAFEHRLKRASEEQEELFRKMSFLARRPEFDVNENPYPKQAKQLIEKAKSESLDIPAKAASVPAQEQADKEDGKRLFAVAVSIALSIITLSLVFYSMSLHSELSKTQEVVEQKETLISELENEVRRKDQLLSVLEARSIEVISMKGLEINPSGFGKIIRDAENGKALLQVSNLPAVPANKVYRLWVINDNMTSSAGTFSVSETQNESFFVIEEMSQLSKKAGVSFAVTLEPDNEVSQPTGDMYLLGSLNK